MLHFVQGSPPRLPSPRARRAALFCIELLACLMASGCRGKAAEGTGTPPAKIAVVAAVIGSNFFDQVPALFNGPQNKLGIWPPTKSPVIWQVIPRNCNGN